MKILALIVLLYVSIVQASDRSCVSFYTPGIVERFNIVVASRPDDFLGLVIDDFIRSETGKIQSLFDKQLELLDLKGTESKVQSDNITYLVHSRTVDAKLQEVESWLTPGMSKKFLSSAERRKKRLEQVSREFALCRTNMDACAVNFKTEIRTASAAVAEIKTLVKELVIKKAELESLQTYLELNGDSSDITLTHSLSIFQNEISQMARLRDMVEKILATQSQALVSGLYDLRNIPPVRDQKIKDLIAAGAPEVLKDIIVPGKDNADVVVKVEKNETPKVEFREILSSLDMNLSNHQALFMVAKYLDQDIRMSPFEGYSILKKIPKEYGIRWNFGPLYEALRNDHDFEKVPLSLLASIAYQIILKTDRSGKKYDQVLIQEASNILREFAQMRNMTADINNLTALQYIEFYKQSVVTMSASHESQFDNLLSKQSLARVRDSIGPGIKKVVEFILSN